MTGRVLLADMQSVVMPAPLEASETLLPNVMDMDRMWCLFETQMRVRGKCCVSDVYGCLQSQYQLEAEDAR